jgi:uncharacterized protein YceK
VTALAVALISGCTSETTGTDAASSPAPQTAYQRDIDAMTKYCTQNAAQLDSMVGAVHKIEVTHGITDETMTQLAGHLLTAVSGNASRLSCIDLFGAYVTLREGG